MSVLLGFSLLRNNIQSSCPVRIFKQHAGLPSRKSIDSRSSEKRLFTTIVQRHERKLTESAGWHKTDSGSCIPAIQPLWPQRNSKHDQPGTVLVFDTETTGWVHKDHRIIEFALRDLSGGKYSTFETLINPERSIPQWITNVTKIGKDLVCKPDTPRFSDVLPVLLAYVRSRQVPGKPILWVAHNARTFDVPFLAQEFDRCSAEIPADWYFIDTMPLARKMMKSKLSLEGNMVKPKGEKEKRPPVNLKALETHYGIHCEEEAHRAMRDVTILCQVFQKITFDLKLTYEELMNGAMKMNIFSKLS